MSARTGVPKCAFPSPPPAPPCSPSPLSPRCLTRGRSKPASSATPCSPAPPSRRASKPKACSASPSGPTSTAPAAAASRSKQSSARVVATVGMARSAASSNFPTARLTIYRSPSACSAAGAISAASRACPTPTPCALMASAPNCAGACSTASRTRWASPCTSSPRSACRTKPPVRPASALVPKTSSSSTKPSSPAAYTVR